VWSSFAHAAIMLVTSFQLPAQRGVLLFAAAVTALSGVLLMIFGPPRSDQASVALPLKNV
jgi:hypothetical protein